MLYDEALDRVKKCVHATLGVDDTPLCPRTTLNDLALDSLNTLDLAYRLEEEFGISHVDARNFSGVTDLDQVTRFVMRVPPQTEEKSYGA